MTDVPAGAGRPGDESESIDDDALADAILATYTSSIPVIRPADDAPVLTDDDRLLAETASWTSFDPSAFEPVPPSALQPGRVPGPESATPPDERRASERGRIWDLDAGAEESRVDLDGGFDEDAEVGPSTVWDLGDLGEARDPRDPVFSDVPGYSGGVGSSGGPDGYESFDLPAPEDATPVDLLADSAPKPWIELPAPSPASKEDDGETWVSTEEPITPFDPQPFPVERTGPWTRLVEPEGSAPAPVADSESVGVWRPPVEWAPPAAGAADLFPAPTPATPELVPQPGPVLPGADDDRAVATADEPPVEDPPAAEQTTREKQTAVPAEEPETPPAAERQAESWDDMPPAPPVGGTGGTATPWFDLASAPPPMVTAPPAQSAPPEPAPPGEPAPHVAPPSPERDRGAELGRGAGDAAYRDDEDGSVDPSDRAPLLIAGLPPGTVQTSTLPPAQAAAVDVVAPPVTPTASARVPRAVEVETAGAEPTRLDQRAGRATRLFWLWFAANAAPLSLGTGAVLIGMGMSLRQAILAVVGGVVLSFLPLGLGALAGRWSGQPTLVVSRASFGLIGNVLPGMVAVLSRAVWGGALLWVVGDAVRVGAERVGAGSVGTLGPLLGVLGAAVLAGVVAVVGYGLLSRVQLGLTVLTAVLAATVIAFTAGRVDLAAALGASDGPWLLVASGVILVFTLVGLAWVHSTADIARYQSATSGGASTMVAASLGAGVPALALIGWGTVLAASSPALARGLAASPLEALVGVLPPWFPVPLLAGVVLASLAGAVIATYSGGFALIGAVVPGGGPGRISRPVATAVAVLLSAAVAVLLVLTGTDARDLIRDVLTTIAVPVAAWAGILLAEIMIRNRRFHTPSLLRRGGIYPDVRVPNLVAFVLISALAFGFTTARVGWLSWQGWALWLLGIPRADPIAGTDIGVFLALALGLLVPLLSAIPVIRRQEAVRA